MEAKERFVPGMVALPFVVSVRASTPAVFRGPEDLRTFLQQALDDDERGLATHRLTLDEKAVDHLIRISVCPGHGHGRHGGVSFYRPTRRGTGPGPDSRLSGHGDQKQQHLRGLRSGPGSYPLHGQPAGAPAYPQCADPADERIGLWTEL